MQGLHQMAYAASSISRSSQLLERREQENEGPAKYHRQSGERKYEAKKERNHWKDLFILRDRENLDKTQFSKRFSPKN